MLGDVKTEPQLWFYFVRLGRSALKTIEGRITLKSSTYYDLLNNKIIFCETFSPFSLVIVLGLFFSLLS